MTTIWEREMERGRIRAMMGAYKRRVGKAMHEVKGMLREHPRSYVSLSWGKQSTIVAHMVFMVSPETPMVFFREPESDIINNFSEVEREFIRRWPINYSVRMLPDKSEAMREAGPRLMTDMGWTGVFMGFSRDESRERRMTLAKDREGIFAYASGTARCCPLASWMLEDYAAYLGQYHLPVLETYRRFGLVARTSSGLTPGSHAEAGADRLSSEQRAQLQSHYAVQGVTRRTYRRRKEGVDYGDDF